MSYASNDEIRGVLIQAGHERVLLPNATVAEMMSKVAVQTVPDRHAIEIDVYDFEKALRKELAEARAA